MAAQRENFNTEEQLLQATLERSILLSITAEVAAAKNKDDLFPIINNTLKRLFSYDDGVICIANDDQQTHSAFLYNPEEVFSKYPGTEDLAALKFSMNDGIYDVIVNAGQVVVFELDEVVKSPNASVYVPFWIHHGMKQLIGVPVKTGPETIGSFSFYTKIRNSIPENQFGLLYGICSQISIAIQNVLTFELNERNNFEKSILLELADELSFASKRSGLAGVISAKLHKLAPVNQVVLGLLNSNENRLQLFNAVLLKNPEPPNDKFQLSESSQDVDLLPLLEKYTYPALVGISDDSVKGRVGTILKQIAEPRVNAAVIVCLTQDSRPIGFMAVFSDVPGLFKASLVGLIKGMASQVSAVAGKILINEDLRNKEQEKGFLLSFSNHIATVRDISGLKYVIKKSLSTLFPIRAYIITIKNDDNLTYQHFLHNLPVADPADEGFKIITGTNMSKKGTLTEAVLASEEPVTFIIKDLLRSNRYFFPAQSFWEAAGAQKVLGIRLKVAEEDMGILWLEPGQINDRLLKGISAQIAIALANALANASLEKQFDEIKRYKQRLEEENLYLQEEIGTNYNYGEIIGSSPEILKVFHLLSQVSYANTTVLLLGETGTGKELVARAIHNYSPRKDKIMIKVNCAALPANLIESELFGHEKGSFTGAFEQKIGKFELANNGTLFLDEIGEMPMDLQVKILRVLQEKEIERVGGKKTIKINVRIIAATNRDLLKEVEKGNFRSDLFYRLNVFPITLPTLRQRMEDIPALVDHFINKLSRNMGRRVKGISENALRELMDYSWPGNIRELEHMIERSLLLSTGSLITQVFLPARTKKIKGSSEPFIFKTIDEHERDYIIAVLSKCGGKIFGPGGAAEILGLPSSTLNSRMKKLQIKKEMYVVKMTDDANE